MKKMIYGVLSLLVPMALVLYGINGVASGVLGILTIALMQIYTANKFRGVGKRRGYRKMEDAFKYASIGNECWAFGYLLLVFCGTKIFVPGFEANPCRFNPLMATMVYACTLGIIACVTYLLKNEKEIGMDQKALMVFIPLFLFCIAMGCIAEIMKAYGRILPDTESLSIMLVASAAGIALAGRRYLKHSEEEYA